MSQSNDFDGGPGKVHPKQRRSAGLPSDLECAWCGDAIPDGERCVQLRRGENSLGAFDPFDLPDTAVICVGCAEK